MESRFEHFLKEMARVPHLMSIGFNKSDFLEK